MRKQISGLHAKGLRSHQFVFLSTAAFDDAEGKSPCSFFVGWLVMLPRLVRGVPDADTFVCFPDGRSIVIYALGFSMPPQLHDGARAQVEDHFESNSACAA
ncbi:hypothetical protein ATY76_29560 [Rhizobium sp. R339]|nr:hypothetical protein ATY76_29560 [Rhizobium sp. R339]